MKYLVKPQYDDYNNDSQQELDTDVIGGDTRLHSQILVLRRNCLLLCAIDKFWLRTTLFRSTCSIGEKICKLIINSGICINIISATFIHKLTLKSELHPSPYKLVWLNNDTKISVSRQTLISFSIGTYKDKVSCDIVPMDTCHLLLRRLWQYDRDAIHKGKTNTYSFMFQDCMVTVLPSREPEKTTSIAGNKKITESSIKHGQSLLTA